MIRRPPRSTRTDTLFPYTTLFRSVEKFTVLEHDGVIYGCVAVIPYISESMAEMACLIVQQEWQGTGEGEMLLRHAELRARAMGAKRLFVLTTRTSHRSEEHTSELQSLMRISYAVFCLKKKNT